MFASQGVMDFYARTGPHVQLQAVVYSSKLGVLVTESKVRNPCLQ